VHTAGLPGVWVDRKDAVVVEELVLVRHGESMGNIAAAAARASGAEQIDIGQRDPDVSLSPVGLAQAHALGAGLAAYLSGSVAVWSSPYERALQTARVALELAGSPLPIAVDERLRDRELGVLDLLTTAGVARRFPLEAQRRQWWGKFYHRPPGGESWADVVLRLRSFLLDLAGATDAARVVVVSHDAIVMLLRYVLEGLDEHTVLQLGATDPVRNASITVLQRTSARVWQLERFNDVAHLAEQGAPVTEHGGEPDAAH
jgi:broad specificity phosphatase PhoE